MVWVVGVDPGSTKHGFALIGVGSGAACHAKSGHVSTDDLVSFLRAQARATLVAIETTDGVFPGVARKRGAKAAVSVAAASVPAVRADGFIEGVAVGLGLHVLRCPAVEWRMAIVGSRQAADRQIAVVIPRLVNCWPARSNTHERDAAGVALYLARQEILMGMVVA